jgi:hypothetical protein
MAGDLEWARTSRGKRPVIPASQIGLVATSALEANTVPGGQTIFVPHYGFDPLSWKITVYEKILYTPARYKMALPNGIQGVAGGVIFPAGIHAPALTRRGGSALEKKYPHMKNRLLDPQLYLAGLPAVTCRKACVNLASYGWFLSSGLQAYDSSKQSQSEWKNEAQARIHRGWKGNAPLTDQELSKSIMSCILLQENLGCEALILPGP